MPHSLLPYIPASLHPWLRSVILRALACGPLPRHIAFIMDGNRRYARRRDVPAQVGHVEGFEALKRVLSFLLRLGIPHVTVFAFSIENFNRPPQEVDALMDLARHRLAELCDRDSVLAAHGVRIKVIGRRELLPVDVLEACEAAEARTRNNKRGILNFCCPYSSQEEMAQALRATIVGVVEGKDDESAPGPSGVSHTAPSITADAIAANLPTSESPPVDVLIRTSNVHRLSDFLLWQSNDDTVLHFIAPNWPDISLVDVLPPLLSYQAQCLLTYLGVYLGFFLNAILLPLNIATGFGEGLFGAQETRVKAE